MGGQERAGASQPAGNLRPFHLVPLLGPGEEGHLAVSIFKQHIPQSSGFYPRNPPLQIEKHRTEEVAFLWVKGSLLGIFLTENTWMCLTFVHQALAHVTSFQLYRKGFSVKTPFPERIYTGSIHFSGQPAPAPHHLYHKKFLPST